MTVFVRALPYAITYAVLTGTGSPWNWLLGFLFGCLVSLASGGWRADAGIGSIRRLAWLPWLICGAAVSVLRGSWQMLRVLTGMRPWHRVGLVTSSGVTQSEAGLTLLGLVQSASPGQVVAEIDGETRTLVVNAIDASNPEETRATIADFYDRYQRRSVP